MLPPFVPPSARVPSESLPLITQFVIDRGAHASAHAGVRADEHAGAVAAVTEAPEESMAPEMAAPEAATHEAATPPRTWTNEDVGALPSIDEFLMERPSSRPHADGADQAPEQAAESPAEAARPAGVPAAGIEPAELEREEGEPIPPAQGEVMIPPESADALAVKESTPPGAVFNDEAPSAEAEAPGITESEAWAASAVAPSEVPEALAGEGDEWGPPPSAGPHAESSAEAWVAEERDAYDWQSVGTIAAGPDEARRAAEAWEGTEWESRRSPEQEQVATALMQLARRVRAGEMKLDVPPNASVEASLAAVLAALLANTNE